MIDRGTMLGLAVLTALVCAIIAGAMGSCAAPLLQPQPSPAMELHEQAAELMRRDGAIPPAIDEARLRLYLSYLHLAAVSTHLAQALEPPEPWWQGPAHALLYMLTGNAAVSIFLSRRRGHANLAAALGPGTSWGQRLLSLIALVLPIASPPAARARRAGPAG